MGRMPCAVTSQLNEHDRLMQEMDDAEERRVDIECKLLADEQKWRKFVRDTIAAVGMTQEQLIDALAEVTALRYAADSQAAVRAWDANVEWNNWCNEDSDAMDAALKVYVDAEIKQQDDDAQPDYSDDDFPYDND